MSKVNSNRILLGVILTSLMLTGCHKGSDASSTSAKDQSLNVDTVVLKPRAINVTAHLSGRAHAYNEAEVRPQVDGIIQRRMFREGGEVTAGEQLYQIDPARYEAAQSRAAATLFSANALARRDKPLVDAGAISHQQYDDAVASAMTAAADLRTAQINVGYTRVRAPLTGIISRSSVTQGALVTDGQATALATITQLDPIYVDVTEPYAELVSQKEKLANGQLQQDAPIVELSLPDGSTYPIKGRLDFSEVNVDESTESVTLRATFRNPNHVLLPGMFVYANLNIGAYQHAIMVPQQAIVRDSNGNPTVYIVDHNGRARQVHITTAAMIGSDYHVISGLSPDDTVIVDNLQSIHDGQKVNASQVDNTGRMSEGGSEMSYIDPAAR